MTQTLRQLEPQLRNSPNEWRWHAANVISEIPEGYLASYKTIARVTNERTGLRIRARNVAWLRRHLYHITDRSVALPLHRMACVGDVHFARDSATTRRMSRTKRRQEGLHYDPPWWEPR